MEMALLICFALMEEDIGQDLETAIEVSKEISDKCIALMVGVIIMVHMFNMLTLMETVKMT